MNFLPSAVTLMNLGMGVISLMLAFNHQLRWAALFVLFAVICDVMDGILARRLNASSDFGKELDSLADMVSFGAAPAFLVLELLRPFETPGTLSTLAIVACILYIFCGAYRLARFNVLNISEYYVGVPITLAGGLIGLLILAVTAMPGWFYLMVLLILSGLMISRITVPKTPWRNPRKITA